MPNTKRLVLAFFIVATFLVGVFWSPPSVSATSRKQFFDFGPYYNQAQVLGLSFSVLENLPVPQIPPEIVPAKATGILAGSPFYPLEKVVENIQLTFTFDPVAKENLRIGFAEERLSEAKTLLERGKTEAVASALTDYSQTVRTITQNLSSQTADGVEARLAGAAVYVQSVILVSPPAQAEDWAVALEAGSQALDRAAEVKGAPAVPDQLSTALQLLKQNGLIAEEESNKLYSFKARGEVREELDKLVSAGQFPPSELTKLDTAIASRYPQIQSQYEANLQVAELRTYQTLPQPSEEVLDSIIQWQRDPSQAPPNDVKPYLWYNRSQELAKTVDLTNFSPEQSAEVAKFYSAAVVENPTYSPSPSSTPTPTPAAADENALLPSPTPSVQPSPTLVPVTQYLGEVGGALPGTPAYFIKRFGEESSEFFTFDSAQKARLKMQQAERRLAEAAALANDPKKAALYQSTIKDYRSAVKSASDYLKNADRSKEVREAARRLESQAGRHEAVLEKGLLLSQDPKLIAEVIKVTEDAMDRSADVLGKPALPQALAVRLGDLKAQGLILSEEADDLVRSNSREEIRGKIRKLTELGTFPPADAKKLDEAQLQSSPTEYNQLAEVRKIEELQNLRSTQTDLAQTPFLKSQATTLAQKETALTGSFDYALIDRIEDLGGRENLIKTYERLAAIPRPINGGQFGAEATPGAQPVAVTPKPQDAVLSTCPEGAVFKQLEGCVWADSGRKINDYDQYKCEGPRQYYSFAVRKCVAYDAAKGYNEDAQPVCPVGYSWSWQTQSCQAFTGGGPLPLPSPSAEPEPIDDKEREERSKSCPEGSSYKAPNGCVWEKNGKTVNDSTDYRCKSNQYYSFKELKCVPQPKPGDDPKDFTPSCKDPSAYWSWSDGKCAWPRPIEGGIKEINIPKPTFVPPSNPFYFAKQWGEGLQRTFAFTPQAKEQVSLSQAKERLAEAADALKRDDKQGFKKAINSYTFMMQNIVSDVSKEQLTEGAKAEIGKRLSEEAVKQNLMLEKLSAWATQTQDADISAAVSVSILGVDKAADFSGEPPIPGELKSKIEALPEKMISEEDRKKLLEMDSRVEARVKLQGLIESNILTQKDTAFLNKGFDAVDQNTRIKVEELKKLEQIADAGESKEKLEKKIDKNEEIVTKLAEFEKTFEAGKDVPAEIRPYIRLTRINEISQTIRPDIVRLDDFQNRKDVVLAVATLQEEFRPTKEAFRQVEDFRRRNPNIPLPPDLARVEALSYSLGVRAQAGSCFLPTPPFPANTPCPAPGAAIPIASYVGPVIVDEFRPGWPGGPSVDKEGKSLVYGQGPTPKSTGICPEGYHWMYDSGGWCMSNGGNYNSSYNYTPTGTGAGYTPYSPYYTAPGVPPASYGYQGPGTYSAPSYYGTAPTYYTTNPPAGTVPGSGPKPTSPGQCPSGYHWMSDSGGWCMADGPTYVPSGTTTSATQPSGGYNCGSQPYDPVTKKCKDGACPGGFSWNGGQCVASPYSPNLTQSSCGPGYYWDGRGCIRTSPTDTPSSYQYGCTPGYYWDGSKCVAGSYEGSGWSDTAARSGTYCQPPSSGCGSNSYWDYGSCSCRNSYSSGYNTSTSTCTQQTCRSGEWFDWGTCSCRPTGNTYTPTSGTTGTSGGTSSGGSCPSGSHWMSDNGGYCMSDATSGGSTSSGGSSSGSCPSGYHWMSDSGGWCMADGGSGGSSTTTTTTEPTPAPTEDTTTTTTTTTTTEPTPAPTVSP
ncbi:MAG: hypothetical protein HY376_03430 [Candidatus Blackburnbacteria bacterium]|nr:hypothetical protein [Candidatus Blackburnbacteria bacterium]